MGLTERRIHALLLAIGKRIRREREFQAKLFGKELKGDVQEELGSRPTFSPEQEALAMKAHEAAVRRVKQERTSV